MSEYADAPHVLILRLWCEPSMSDDLACEWRALIEDVGTSTRYPVRDMAVLYALLAPHEDAMGLDDFLAGQKVQNEG